MINRTGIGIDIHPLVAGRDLVLGGVVIPYPLGLDGHSDGDVLIHAIIDACLGAANMGDIGTRFPSSDDSYRGICSRELLVETQRMLAVQQWRMEYLDATIVAEKPMLRPYIADMRASVAESLSVDTGSVSLKATTTDKLGFAGRGEGICSIAVVTISRT